MGPLQPSHDDVWKVHRLLTSEPVPHVCRLIVSHHPSEIYRYDARLIKVLIDDGVEEAPTKDTIVRTGEHLDTLM